MVQTASVVRRAPSSNGLYDVVDLILDKGLVIDAYLRVSLVGIEILTVDLRVVIASVDTYLRFAEAVDRLALQEQGGRTLDELIAGGDGRVSSGGGGGRDERGEDERGRGPVRRVVDAVTPGNDEDKE